MAALAWAIVVAIGALVVVALLGLLLYVAVAIADVFVILERRLRSRKRRWKVDTH